MVWLSIFNLAFVTIFLILIEVHSNDKDFTYGVDVSYPMHHGNISEQEQSQLGNRQEFYNQLIQGCMDFYGESNGKRCLRIERDRIQMSLRQPQSMINYTKTGFAKMRAPDYVFETLKMFWDLNKDRASNEKWVPGNTYTNHWEIKTDLLNVENPNLTGGGRFLKQKIWNAARETISEWTGQQLVECSLYGIRIYKEGSVLATHVDRLPLVASAIINVDQDVDEPWPLEVIGHDGIAHNVTMEPGDLVLYESHSILHGRPFPLKGRFMANVFIHFEPIGIIGENITYPKPKGTLPPYVLPGSPEEPHWRKQNPSGHKLMIDPSPSTTDRNYSFAAGKTFVHRYAQTGEIGHLMKILDSKYGARYLNAKDEDGFTPLHEAVRRDNLKVVIYLVQKGANVNALSEDGCSPLWWAIYERRYKGHGHSPIIDYLISVGAKEIGNKDNKAPKGLTEAHIHVINGQIEELASLIFNPSGNNNKDEKGEKFDYVNAKDENGFTPLHEAVRRDNEEIVHLLVSLGADVNALTEEGHSALWWAKYDRKQTGRPQAHPIIDFLISVGAQQVGPEF